MTDKIIRGTVAAIIALLYLANIITGTTALILGSIALFYYYKCHQLLSNVCIIWPVAVATKSKTKL
jgi:hypothetical protein